MSVGGALVGRTVVVTRATEQAGTLRSLLEAEGAVVLELPLIHVVAADDGGAALRAALEDPDRFDWIVVTSPNGAARVVEVLAGRVGRARWAAVGRGTEAALGRPADLVPIRQVAEGLLAEFPPGPGRVLVVQGDRARPTLVDGLRAAGWLVEAPVAYRNVPADVAPELLARAAGADVITFASGSAVLAYLVAAGPPPAAIAVVSIGPATTATATRAGIRVDRTAADHSLAGLVAAVREVLASRSENG